MKTIKKIKGMWNNTCKYVFNRYDLWTGEILLEEDGWFEGIVKEHINDKRFVFGVILPEQSIELLKVAPIKVTIPSRYHACSFNGEYQGKIYEMGMFGQFLSGVSKIEIEDLENSQNKEEIIQKRIDDYKSNMDKVCIELYERMYNMRPMISQDVLCGNSTNFYLNPYTEYQDLFSSILSSSEEQSLKLIPINKK